MLCKNYGIIHFTNGSHTLFGVQRPSLAPQNGSQVDIRLRGGTFLVSKITSAGLPCARQVIAGLTFRAAVKNAACGPRGTLKVTSLSMSCNNYGIIRLTNGNTDISWRSETPFGTQNMALVVPKAPLKRLHCRCYAKNAESSSSSSSSEYNVTVTHKLWITLCYGWRVGIVQPKCVTASAVTAAAVTD